MGIWDDDPTFKAIGNNKDIRLKHLSWQCSNLLCEDCDGFIHYKFKKVESEFVDATTGKVTQKIVDFEWDTEHESVLLDGGITQNRENTPEGSRCECHHCHGRPGYDEWKKKAKQRNEKRLVGVGFVSKYKQNELAPDEKEGLR